MISVDPRRLDGAAFARRLASGPPGLRGLLAIRLAPSQRLAALLDETGHRAFEQSLHEALGPLLETADRWSRPAPEDLWILFEGLAHDEQARRRARNLLEAMQRVPGSGSGAASPSCAGALVLHDGPAGTAARDWLSCALEAASRSRRQDDALEVHTFESAFATDRDEVLEPLLREMLAADGLELHYQPQVALDDGRCVQVEALVRWPHTAGAPGLDAARLADLAERRGLIGALTRRVLDGALAQLRAWEDEGLHLDVSVNLSSLDLEDARVASFVLESCERHRLAPCRLTLELTESRVLRHRAAALAFLQPMRAAGCRIALDDFGTGYASIATLRGLPFDELKIDRSFVADLETDAQAPAFAGALVALGRALGLQTLAEGIETAGQAQALARAGCDRGQGYWWSAPRPAADFARWQAAFTPTPMAGANALR